MKHEDIPNQAGPQQTRWSLVRRAANPGTPEGFAALDELLHLYLPPIDRYLQSHRGLSLEDAEDIRQSFIERRILAGELLKQADPAKGKFRNLLFKSIQRFANSHRRLPDNQRLVFVPPDEQSLPPVAPPASREFDVEWAKSVVAQAKANARAFYETRGQHRMWDLFEEHQSGSASDRGRISALGAKYGCSSDQEVSNFVVTVQRKLGTELRNVVRDYVAEGDGADGEVVDAEIRELIQILSRDESQPEFGSAAECKNRDAEA